MRSRGFIITVTALYFVILFLLFLSFISSPEVKKINTDKQMIQTYQNYVNFNKGDTNISILGDSKWCSNFFIYEPYDYEINSDRGIIYIHYCEDYENKRFI